MSADNYYVIRKDGNKFAVVQGFASDEYPDFFPTVQPHSPRFDTITQALNYAESEYSEYGVRLHPEVENDMPEKVMERAIREAVKRLETLNDIVRDPDVEDIRDLLAAALKEQA